MNYEKMSRAMRYHYGSEKKGRKGHLAMVKEKRLCYRLNSPSSIKRHENVKIVLFSRFGELSVNWRRGEMLSALQNCEKHRLCQNRLCLWTRE